jgi:hypothetical protein
VGQEEGSQRFAELNRLDGRQASVDAGGVVRWLDLGPGIFRAGWQRALESKVADDVPESVRKFLLGDQADNWVAADQALVDLAGDTSRFLDEEVVNRRTGIGDWGCHCRPPVFKSSLGKTPI